MNTVLKNTIVLAEEIKIKDKEYILQSLVYQSSREGNTHPTIRAHPYVYTYIATDCRRARDGEKERETEVK